MGRSTSRLDQSVTTTNVSKNIACLACGSNNVHTALDLGHQPLANDYIKDQNSPQETYPLAVDLCQDCFHLQLSHVVDPAIIYKNYLYATGTNHTIKEYSQWFANFAKEYVPDAKSVLDIGCNDGTQLDYFKTLGLATYGIDPAENLHERSQKNHNTICDFFGPSAISQLKDQLYDIITAQNVFAHNPNPADFLKSCWEIMNDNTMLFLQTSQADMVLNQEFDTIYHEHVNFFNINSMYRLAARSGLNLIDVVKSPIHGTSYIFILSKTQARPYYIQNLIKMEEEKGLLLLDTYIIWKKSVVKNVADLVTTLNQLRDQGYVLVGYGAAAKGNTLLNFGNIHLDFIIDDNPLKQNLYTPGTLCPIVGIEKLQKYTNNDRLTFIPLAWNFFKEIKTKIQKVRYCETDLFVKYFPKVEIKK